MPRTARAVESGGIYHVLNRGNGRMRLFYKDEDYAAFLKVLTEGLSRHPVDLLAYCLMPNHWHLVLRPTTAISLAGLMRWVGVTHVSRHHAHHRHAAGGHLYQGRYKSFPVQDDSHFLTLCRYVEANARRAGLVRAAEKWPWSSLWQRTQREQTPELSPWPLPRPRNWVATVNEVLDPREIERLRTSVNRGRPFGEDTWVQRTARRLSLEFTLRPRGRPRKVKQDEK